MEKIVTFSIEDKGIIKGRLDFIVERLKPFEQFNLILKIISIIAKGGAGNSAQLEQTLHNVFQTGKEVDGVKDMANDIAPFKLILDAIKGALAELSEKDRDWLISELLKNVKIDCGNSLTFKATTEELDNRCTSFQPIFKLLQQLVKVNLGFL